MTRAFIYAGAESVVVSLWEVNKWSTPDLMGNFYSHMATQSKPSAALRQAKLEMLASKVPGYNHPYYWAPFVLVGGNWK